MKDNTMSLNAGTAPARSHPFLRGFVAGAASLFDIFRAGAHPQKHSTPADDSNALYGDVEQIAQDFHAVLSGIESRSKK